VLFLQWAYGIYRPPDFVDEVGRLEQVDADVIRGWARLRSKPAIPVQVEISVDGQVVQTVTADVFRQDLADGHVGTGRHEFILETPPFIRDGRAHNVDAKLVGTNLYLADTPMTVTLPMKGEKP
jgi:hypothetical protein